MRIYNQGPIAYKDITNILEEKIQKYIFRQQPKLPPHIEDYIDDRTWLSSFSSPTELALQIRFHLICYFDG